MLITLEKLLTRRGYELKQARLLIQAGQVYVNHEQVFVPSIKVDPKSELKIKASKTWVSRGALKLLKAIEVFQLKLNNQVVLDIGSSTGGFTQVALTYGAKKVYAVDVGTNQLDFSLRRNAKVIVQEQTNLKTLTLAMFEENIDLVVCDVSFISLEHVFKVLQNIIKPKVQVMALIKPQFEAYRDQVAPGGFVPPKFHPEIIQRVIDHGRRYNFVMIAIETSPIKGSKAQNVEYISIFERR